MSIVEEGFIYYSIHKSSDGQGGAEGFLRQEHRLGRDSGRDWRGDLPARHPGHVLE